MDARDDDGRRPPLILALDISKTCTGIAEGRAGSPPRSYSIKGKDCDTVGAVCQLGKWLIERTAVDRPDWIYFEAPLHMGAFGKWDPEEHRVKATSNPDTIITLAKMVGVVEFVAASRRIPARPANVHSVRKDFIGHGNLKGPEAKRRAFEICRAIGWAPANRDEFDALAVWHFACLRVAPHDAALITPMMQRQVGATIGGVDIGGALFKAARSA